MVTHPQQEICDNVFFVRSGSVFELVLVLYIIHGLIFLISNFRICIFLNLRVGTVQEL